MLTPCPLENKVRLPFNNETRETDVRDHKTGNVSFHLDLDKVNVN
jgi:hypothetical protein